MSMNDSKELWLNLEKDIQPKAHELGRYTTQAYHDDPCALSFITSRYKFCSRILGSAKTVIEIGCGDGFGSALVAQKVPRVICTDINEGLLEENRSRMSSFSNVEFVYHDFRDKPFVEQVDGIYLVDVLEHIFQKEEESFLDNLCLSLNQHGICVIGTPNKTSEQYASVFSQEGHINLKDHAELKDLGEARFFNHFIFGMNDEVVHTGFPAMAHFQWLVGIGPRGK
ncbi:MAG: class I SAM-dependent methyltransferase [SAR202 cluster bacterium]|nr:class I SAM-dependent methyltransferase [SAR202 cluster bacterium]